MTTSHKVALSLLISVLLFGLFTVLAFTGLFDLMEARFYNPSKTASITNDLTRNANEIDKFLAETQARFSDTLLAPAIKRSFLPNQSAEDIFERSRIYGLLTESLGGFQWVRFIDSGGSRLHFSTYAADIQQQDRFSVSYRNYDAINFSYDTIAVRDTEEPVYIFDERGDCILFAFPFYDSLDVYRGTALFSLSIQAVADKLVSEGRIRVGQDLSVISDPKGLLSGMSSVGERVLPVQVSTIWKEGWQKTARLVSPSSGLSLALITVQTKQGFLVGRLVNEEIFLFPQPMKIILLIAFFLTIYLIIFLLFNLRQDSVTIVQNRLKKLQISLIEQFYERKGDVDWARWSRELDQRRDEISLQLKQGVKTSVGQDKDIDDLIDKSWDELLSVMGGRKEAGIDEDKLQLVLNRILAALPTSGIPAKISAQPAVIQPVAPGKADEPEEVEEIEAIEAIEEVEEPEAAELEDIEAVEAVEEIAEAEEVEEVEAVEAIEEVEEPEAVELEDIEAVEAIEELEDMEPVSAIEPSVEIPVIDVMDMDFSTPDVEEVVQAISLEDHVDELEELEEMDVVEAEPETPQPNLGAIDKLASQIEFSSDDEVSFSAEDSLGDFEVVSPFSSMTFDFSNIDDDLIILEEEGIDESTENTPAVLVEEVSGTPSKLTESTSLVSQLFLDAAASTDVEILEALDEDDDDIPIIEAAPDDESTDENVIEEREGVPYISGDVLSSGGETVSGLNQDFKDLVDSVIK